MTDTTGGTADEQQPSTEDLEEPSTEKDVDEEPRAKTPHDPEPDHQAVGIGVVGGPESEAERQAENSAERDAETAADDQAGTPATGDGAEATTGGSVTP